MNTREWWILAFAVCATLAGLVNIVIALFQRHRPLLPPIIIRTFPDGTTALIETAGEVHSDNQHLHTRNALEQIHQETLAAINGVRRHLSSTQDELLPQVDRITVDVNWMKAKLERFFSLPSAPHDYPEEKPGARAND